LGVSPGAIISPGGVTAAKAGNRCRVAQTCFLARFDLTGAGLCPRGGVLSCAGEVRGRRHVEGKRTVTTKARRQQRIKEDPDFRAREKERRRAYYEANKEHLRARRQQRCYGLTRADYEALLAAQGGVCPLCGKRSEKTLCVDHCHETGTIRGLLCRQCNFALGCFTDSQAAMMAALAYLGGSKNDRAGAAAQRASAPVQRPPAAAPRGRCGTRLMPSSGAKAMTAKAARPASRN
jgi:hypothetical protein